MNVYDSARMADSLAADGYRRVEEPEDANIVVLNTCHIREKAAEKVYSELGRLRRYKEREPSLIIVVGGCVAQAEGGRSTAASALCRCRVWATNVPSFAGTH